MNTIKKLGVFLLTTKRAYQTRSIVQTTKDSPKMIYLINFLFFLCISGIVIASVINFLKLKLKLNFPMAYKNVQKQKVIGKFFFLSCKRRTSTKMQVTPVIITYENRWLWAVALVGGLLISSVITGLTVGLPLGLACCKYG